jgi:hypothetical protein
MLTSKGIVFMIVVGILLVFVTIALARIQDRGIRRISSRLLGLVFMFYVGVWLVECGRK